MLLVPDAASRLQDSAIQGSGPTVVFPGLGQRDQVPNQAAGLGRQGVRDGLQPPLEGASGGIASLLGQQGAQLLHPGGRWLEDSQQGHPQAGTRGGEMAEDHDHQGFQEEAI